MLIIQQGTYTLPNPRWHMVQHSNSHQNMLSTLKKMHHFQIHAPQDPPLTLCDVKEKYGNSF